MLFAIEARHRPCSWYQLRFGSEARQNAAKCTAGEARRDYLKRRLPILAWAPRYKATWLPQDALAGFTVGLTAIPQGIAYGVVAGLSPEYGLYAAFMSSFVYILFGSCENITIGPTAIMATMVQPLVSSYGSDMAVLVTFLKGCIVTLLGVLHLGFLLDFISLPVITGFTSAAAINIASSQFKSLLGIPGRTESFLDSVKEIFSNLDAVRYEDTLLGVCTIVVLVLFKNLPGRRNGTGREQIFWSIALARNATVVVAGTVLAYVSYYNGKEIFQLTGPGRNPIRSLDFASHETWVASGSVIIHIVQALKIKIKECKLWIQHGAQRTEIPAHYTLCPSRTGSMGQGLPPLRPPPFSTTFQNQTYDFVEMTRGMGTALVSIPIVSTIEHMAIAKAFAKGRSLDATQEMFALGLCNIFGSFVSSMPVTGSFTRTAVNHASGVKTPFGGLFTGFLVLLAAGFLTTTFRFIPKATLAGVIVCAMYYMLDFNTYALLWHAKKIDFAVMILTLLPCVFLGLELGIAIGIILNLITLLYFAARPTVDTRIEKIEAQGTSHAIRITPREAIAFPAAEHLRAKVMSLSEKNLYNVILDCKNLKRIDVTVAKNIKLLANDLSLRGQEMIYVNSCENIENILKTVAPEVTNTFRGVVCVNG